MFMRYHCFKTIIVAVILSVSYLFTGDCYSRPFATSLQMGYVADFLSYSSIVVNETTVIPMSYSARKDVVTKHKCQRRKTIIVDKSVHNGVCVLSQDMINRNNTIYVLRYDFFLEDNITIPKGCELIFDGGSINGPYTLIGNDTKIQAPVKQLFGEEVLLSGVWKAQEAYPEWFGAQGDDISDDTKSIQKMLDVGFKRVYFKEGTYLIRGYKDNSGSPVQPGFWGIKIRSNTSVVLHDNAVLKNIPVEGDYYVIVDISGVENVSFTGGQIRGDRHTEHGEWGYGINITNSKNITIQDVKVYDCLGDGISFNGRNTLMYPDRNTSYDCTVKNCEVYNCRRLALAIAGAERLVVEGCKFMNTHGTDPQCAIDIELDIIPGSNKDIEIKNCIMQGNAKGIIWGRGDHENIYIHHCLIDGVRFGKYPVQKLRFESNRITGNFSSEKGTSKSVYVVRECEIANLAGGSANELIFENCSIKSSNINFGYNPSYVVFKDCEIEINNSSDNVSMNCSRLELKNTNVKIKGKSYHLVNSSDFIAVNSSIESDADMTSYSIPIKIYNSLTLKGFSLSSYCNTPSSFIELETDGNVDVYNSAFEAKGNIKASTIFRASKGKSPSLKLNKVTGSNFESSVINTKGKNTVRRVSLSNN